MSPPPSPVVRLRTEVGFRLGLCDSDVFRAPSLKAVEWTLYRIITWHLLPILYLSMQV